VLTLPNYSNIVLWVDMSQELAQLIIDLVNERVLTYSPTEWLVYVADHMILPLPLATEKVQYEEPHWLPVAFSLVDPQANQ
jgi:hypothetical protein